MSGFLLSPAASTDLDEIWEYTVARWGVEQAERYTQGTHDRLPRGWQTSA